MRADIQSEAERGPQRAQVVTAGRLTPFVLRIACRLRRASGVTTGDDAGVPLRGVAAIRSRVDPQAATIRFSADEIRVEHGTTVDADTTLWVDPVSFASVEEAREVSDPFADAVDALLAPRPRPWQAAAREFWEATHDRPGTPRGIRVVCTDDGSDLVLGSGGVEVELHGRAANLVAYFQGDLLLLTAIIGGLLRIRGSINDVSVMQGNGLAAALGDVI